MKNWTKKIKPVKKGFYLNPIAQLYLMAEQLTKVLIAGRGFGKSFINGISIIIKVATLPRSKGMFIGQTYTQILGNTLLPMKAAWEWFGYKENIDYVIGKRPPTWFTKPYHAPERYENVITWWNGTTVVMGSMDRPQLMRGGSNDWIIVDEALLINEEVYSQIITPSVRGTHTIFQDMPGHLGEEFTSSMPYGSFGTWLLEKEVLAQNPENDTFFIKGTSWHNRVILTDKVLQKWKRSMSPLVYLIEVMNVRIANFGQRFYPSLNNKVHYYLNDFDYDLIDGMGGKFDLAKQTSKFDKDCDPKRPLDLGFDFGAFNCLVVVQDHWPFVRVLKSFHVSHPEIIDDLVDHFCDYYEPHQNKTGFIWGDKSGNRKDERARLNTYQMIIKKLSSRKWRGIQKTVGDISHLERHNFFNDVFKEKDSKLPRIRINQTNNKDFIIAMESAGMRGDKKDKRVEHQAIKQEHATHFTDAFDYLMYHKYHHLQGKSGKKVATSIHFGS